MKFTIAQFQTVSGLPLTAEFIVNTLGIKPDEQIKRSMLWEETRYGLILGRLQNYINGIGDRKPALAEKKVRVAADPAADTAPPADDPFSEQPSTPPATKGSDDPFAETSAEEDLFA